MLLNVSENEIYPSNIFLCVLSSARVQVAKKYFKERMLSGDVGFPFAMATKGSWKIEGGMTSWIQSKFTLQFYRHLNVVFWKGVLYIL